jgi:hypothetical protein
MGFIVVFIYEIGDMREMQQNGGFAVNWFGLSRVFDWRHGTLRGSHFVFGLCPMHLVTVK